MNKENIKSIVGKIKEYRCLFLSGLIFGGIIYFLLISNSLVNSNDGLWEYNYYKAGKWSLSLGRWFWLYLDRLRFGISTEPLTSLISLACFSAGFVYIADLFELGKNKVSYLASMLFLSSNVVCISLSYRFMSPTFGLAFLLSVLAVWVICKWKNKIWGILFAGAFMALSMGLYQAYIGCTCFLFVGYVLFVLRDKGIILKDILKLIGRTLLSAVVGGGLYIGILNLHLKIFHISMSDYNGASSYSVGNMIRNFVGSVQGAYSTFSRFFFENYFKVNVLQEFYLFYVAFSLITVLLMIGLIKVWKISKIRAGIYLIFIFLIPVASNAVLLVATQAWTGLLMTAPMALCFPVFLCLEERHISAKRSKLQWVNIALMCLMLYGNVYQVQIDQQAMLEGQIATTTMAEDILHDLNDAGYLDGESEYCFLGVPAANEMFATSVIYEKANTDARFGAWYRDTNCNIRSWQGVFTYLCGSDIKICDAYGYQTAVTDEETANMPVYPQEGYIRKIGDIVIVKVSE